MALIKLYESSNAVTLYGTEIWMSLVGAHGWYMKRFDCVLFNNGSLQSTYKIYRDGTMRRVCQGDGFLYGFDSVIDLPFIVDISGGVNYNIDAISCRYDPSQPATFTNANVIFRRVYRWQGVNYVISAATLVTKYNDAGSSLGTFNVTGSITPFSADTWAITDDGILVAIDHDNGTYGVVRFYDLINSTPLHTSVFDRAIHAFVDTKNKNIWSIDAVTSKLKTWSFDVAPTSFSAITSTGNHARYRQDTLSVTLRGSVSEPVPNWPVKWTLSTAEGHLRDEVVDTDASGVATNLYCGPGATDYVGGSQTIQVETGY